MKRMKYVLNSENYNFVFIPETMAHSDVQGYWTNAGFVDFDTNFRDECGNVTVKALCFGKSISLGLECGSDDQDIINRAIKDDWY